MSKPATDTYAADEAVVKPAIMRMVVVLPGTVGPQKADDLALVHQNVMSWTMVFEPKALGYRFQGDCSDGSVH